jgi:hypothetical protein
MSVAPGSQIELEILRLPRRAAAVKTLTRLCAKDAEVRKAHRTRQKKRPSWQEWVRGGMMWHHQMKSVPMVTLKPGAKYAIRASVDVLRDLDSVSEYVKVSKK